MVARAPLWAELPRLAELARAPALLTRVVPRLLLARAARRESLLHLARAQARRRPEQVALVFGDRRVTYRDLVDESERAASWLVQHGVEAGDSIALIGRNSLVYVVLLLAASALGAPVALISPELEGAALARAVEQASCRLGFCEAGSTPRVASALPAARLLSYDGTAGWPWSEAAAAPIASAARAWPPGGDADFVYIYTSGTTGTSKPCRVSHRRAVLAAIAFGHLVHRLGPQDVVYCALPLHHSTGLLLGLGACLATGATLALRDRFSASALLSDVRKFDATVLLYVGDLLRAWLAQPESSDDRRHRLRLAVGNGLAAELWRPLQDRFGLPRITEFYAASEFPGAIVNLTGRRGSVGRLPLGRFRGYRLLRVDVTSGRLQRDAAGRAIECGQDEPGELVLRLKTRRERPTGDYLGYLKHEPGEERVARDVLEPGDVYCRTGDLLRRDASGHYFFVDRLGDTFRFKGVNVSTREVESAFSGLPGAQALLSLGVRLPNHDGKLGLLVIEAEPSFSVELAAERARSVDSSSRPRFLRLVAKLERTESLKIKKADFAAEGIDPARVRGPLFYWSEERYRPLGDAEYAKILEGELRL